jgi:RHS repeat-associated protein
VSGENHYQLSGKEFENDYDLGWSDHGMRRYDPALARWTGVDPLAGVYADMSPYHYVVGNPVSFVDLNGAEVGGPGGGGYSYACMGESWGDTSGDEAEGSEEGEEDGEEDSGGGGSAFDGGGGMSTDGGDPMSGEYYVYHRSEIQSGGTAAGGGTVNGAPPSTFELPVITITANKTGIRQKDGRRIDVNGNYSPNVNTNSTAGDRAKQGAAALVLLAADDVTGIGVLDDIAIPFVVIGYGIYTFDGWVRSVSIDFPVTIPLDYTTTNGVDTDYKDGMITLFRGVSTDHPGYPNALMGIAAPIGGHDDAERHNSGNTKSVYTSWTTTPWQAMAWANRGGGIGIILVQRFKASETTPSPDFHQQGEVLIRGIVTGAIPIPSPR